MSTKIEITVSVNGESIQQMVEPRLSLADFLRQDLQLTGSHLGCEYGMCGACSVRLNGLVVRACLLFAVQVDGANIETVEGLTASQKIIDLQQAFRKQNALQCGFCTPGMLMTASELLKKKPNANRDEIREFISGNYCRCTGYQSIVNAIEEVINNRRKEAAE